MPGIRNRVASALVVTALTGCAAGPGDGRLTPAADSINAGQAMPAGMQPVVDAAKRDASSRLNIDPGAVEVVSAEQVTWSDGSLGCAAPGMQYTQALVPGYRVMLRAAGQVWDYHAAANGNPALCPPERAIEPIQYDRI
jgi:hypothetical protein